MRILGIESSCDETSLALVEDGKKVLFCHVASQIARHQPFGGVVPEIASREHLKALPELLKVCGVFEKPDAIAVTQGPGLVGCLLVGASFARGLAAQWNIPLIPVNHVHAHLSAVFLDQTKVPEFPALALVLSGGHTNIYLAESPSRQKLIGYSVDDASGECFDKIGKMLGLPYPAGARMEMEARQFQGKDKPLLPRTVRVQDGELLLSFSGLKTAASLWIAQNPQVDLTSFCYAVQEAIFEQILQKIAKALRLNPNIKSVIVAGGVAANQYFQSQYQSRIGLPFFAPHLRYCADNAAMIASRAYFELQEANKIAAMRSEWDVFPRYPFEESLG